MKKEYREIIESHKWFSIFFLPFYYIILIKEALFYELFQYIHFALRVAKFET